MEIFFRVTGILCGEFTGSGEFPAQRTQSFDVLFNLHLNKRLSNNREAGDLRRRRVHYHVIVKHLIIIRLPLYCCWTKPENYGLCISRIDTNWFYDWKHKNTHKILNPVQYNGWGTFCFGKTLFVIGNIQCLCRAIRGIFWLTHWGRDEIDAITQMTFSSAFFWEKMFEFQLKSYWSLFLRVQHWFR